MRFTLYRCPSRLTLLPRHRDPQRFLWRDQVIVGFRIFGDSQLNALYAPGKAIAVRPIIGRDRRAGVLPHVATVVGGEDHRGGGTDLAFADFLSINEQ